MHDPRRVVNRPAPNISLHVLEMETPVKEIAKLYSQVRRRLNITKPGPKISKRDEVVGFFALEVKEIEGEWMGKDGFYRKVLKRWKDHAPLYGFDSNHYKTEEAIRSVLRRIEEAHRKQELAVLGQGPYAVHVPLFK